jgi:hypothetical protein
MHWPVDVQVVSDVVPRLVEFALMLGASAALLLSAFWTRGPALVAWTALALGLVVALTVAQPFGVVAQAESAAPSPPAQARVAPTAAQESLAGPLRFRLVRSPTVYGGGGDSSDPPEDLRVESSVAGWFVRNRAYVTGLCGVVFNPCPRSHRDIWIGRQDHSWVLWIKGDPHSPRYPAAFQWRLKFGVASLSGLAYWLLYFALALLVLIHRRLPRRSARATHSRRLGAGDP